MERLQKVLARAGVASRRKAEELIRQGRVRVNGVVVTRLGTRVDPEADRLEVDGRRVGPAPESVCIALYKPRGYLSTASDPRGRRTVLDLVPHGLGRLFPVGRLDRDSEGLLLLTNDGELAFSLTHPRHRAVRVYLAEVEGVPSEAALNALRRGVVLEDGPTAPCRVELVRDRGEAALLRLSLRQGRKRQVRRMLDSVGHPVLRLTRVQMGPVSLGGMRPGEWRWLDAEELSKLKGRRGGATGGQDGAFGDRHAAGLRGGGRGALLRRGQPRHRPRGGPADQGGAGQG
ncbi:MAG: rRNA pseudouridine synthase [Acetobacteraceae bacterium]|nr:rRNA pseudouridine synthase [Acetobacteraceae bacterium]